MKHAIILAGLLAVAPALPVAAADRAAEQPTAVERLSAEEFARLASISGLFEVESSRLALERSKNEDVRRFAQTMVEDHTKANERLMRTAREGVQTELDGIHRDLLDRLKAADAGSFDAAYVSEQVNAHQKAVDLFNGYAEGGDDAALKAFARETLPTLRKHLEMVRAMQR
jgi:putative membrane protein